MKKLSQICILALFVLMVCPICAQEKEKVYGDWALRCTGGKSTCILEQRVYVKKAGETPLIQMVIERLETGKDGRRTSGLWVLLRAPLGIRLAPGVQFKVDQGASRKIPVHHCQATGCMVLFPLDSTLRRLLEGGREAWVTFEAINGQRVGVPVSLKGIKAGFKALDDAAKGASKRSN